MRMIEESELFQRKGKRGGRIQLSSELKKIGVSKDTLGWVKNKKEKTTKQYETIDTRGLNKTINFDRKKEKSSFKKFEEQGYEEYDGMNIGYMPIESDDKKEGKSNYENKEK